MEKALLLIEAVVVALIAVAAERLSERALWPVVGLGLVAVFWGNWGRQLRSNRVGFNVARLASVVLVAGSIYLWFLPVSTEPKTTASPKPPTAAAPASTATLTLSGNTTLTIQPGQSFEYSWRSRQGQTACMLVVNNVFASGISLAGTDGPIPVGHPWYPVAGRPTVMILSCTDGVTSTSDIGLVSLAVDAAQDAGSLEQKLIRLGFSLERDQNTMTAAAVIEQVKALEAGSMSPAQRVRAAILLFQAYRIQNDLRAGCQALRAVLDVAGESEYARGLDVLLVNHCAT